MTRVFGIAALVLGMSVGVAKADPPAPVVPSGGAIVGRVTRGGKPIAADVIVRRLFGLMETKSGFRGLATYERRFAGTEAVPTVAATRSDEQGHYVVANLDPAAYEAVAADAEGVRTSVAFAVPVEGVRIQVDVPLPAVVYDFHGRVRTADGKAFNGSLAVLSEDQYQSFHQSAPRGASLAVDSEGRFVAHALPAGGYRLVAVNPGRMALWSDVIRVPRAEPISLVVDAGLVPLQATVVADDDGTPVAGVVLLSSCVMFESGARALIRGVTDAEGKCLLLRTPAPRYIGVWAYAAGFAVGEVDGIALAGKSEAIIRLRRAARIVGRVTRAADGAPVAGLAVHAFAPEGADSEWRAAHAVTDSDGRYVLEGLDPEAVLVYAEGSGWATTGIELRSARGEVPIRHVLQPGKTTTADFQVVPAALVGGRVLDAEGKPIKGALVQATARDEIGWNRFGLDRSVRESAASLADGSFEFHTLVRGMNYGISAAAPGHPVASVERVTLSRTDPFSVEIRFLPDRRLDVVLIDDVSEEPVAGADVELHVYARDDPPRGPGATVSGRSGSDGHFHAEALPPGSGTIDVSGAGHAPRQIYFRDEGATAVTVRLSPGRSVAGRVWMPDGKRPAMGVTVGVEGAGLDGPYTRPVVWTESEGRFRFEGLPPGPVLVHVTYEGHGHSGTAHVGAEAGREDVEIVLPPLVRNEESEGTPLLQVHVRDPQGAPVARAFVVISTGGGSQSEWAKNGVAAFTELPEGLGPDMTLEVDRPEDEKEVALPLAPVDMRIDRKPGVVTVVLPAEHRIYGRLMGPDGTAVGGVRIQAVRVSHWRPGDWGKRLGPSETTDASGRFDIGGLADEEHVLLLRPSNAFAPAVPPRVRAGAKGVVVSLRAAVAVDVRVLDAKGLPVPRAAVRVSASQGAVEGAGRTGETDSSGVARLEGLAADLLYDLKVEGPSGDRSHDATRINGWKPRDETVRLNAARNITGTVRDPGGRPLGGIVVMIDEGGRGYGGLPSWRAWTKPDGSFAFEQVPQGELKLAFWKPDVGGPRHVALLVAGATSADLVLDHGLTLVVHVRNRHDPDKDKSHEAVLWSESDVGKAYLHTSDISADDGTAIFGGLKDGETYRLAITAVGGFSAARGGLRAGDNVVVALTRGGTVRGHVYAPPGVGRAGVWVAAGWKEIVYITASADGAFVLDGVPEGRWPIYAREYYAGKTFEAEGVVEAGDEIDLTLKMR